jgi:hypothetical protein
MIRQARRYLVGATGSVTVISIAIVAFVLLVSAQVFTNWPVEALGGGGNDAAVATADAVGTAPSGAPGAPKTVNPGAAAANTTAAGGGSQAGGDRVEAPQDNTSVGSSAPPVTSSEPVDGPAGNSPSGSDPSESPAPAESGSPSGSSPASQSGGNATSPSTGSAGGSKSSSGNVVEEVVQPVTSGSTSAKVTETVNETVNSVDETVTGGALKETGVTGLTEEVVNGVAGPESVVGKTVDEVGKAVGGLLGQH